jgi:hypothetical protein
MKLARRTFAAIGLGAFFGLCQSKPKRLTEEDEWAEAYDLGKTHEAGPSERRIRAQC